MALVLVLETPDGPVFESNAIARYVTRLKVDNPLYGSCPIDYIILTHEHANAVLGLDDVRAVQPFSSTNDIDPTTIYLSQSAMDSCARGSSKQQAVYQRVGHFQVPYLEDTNTGVQMFESADIVEYLRATYALQQVNFVTSPSQILCVYM